ncbi:MAG: TolC family protein [Bacteroidales bacterium]|nr:TolC family protein [Bacteroidales bacterium]
MILKRFIVITILSLFSVSVSSQELLRLEEALEIANENSPEVRKSRLAMQRSKNYLDAQQASLKTNFNLAVDPFNYSREQRFYEVNSRWQTTETYSSMANFSISQPIVATDGVLSLNNRLAWQHSTTEIASELNEDIAFSNNLFLQYSQPLFSYNETRQNLEELELDYERSDIQYRLQKLNTEVQVTRNYYNLYASQMALQISREELENQKKNYEVVQNKVDADLLALEELYQAEVNLASARSQVYTREVQLQNAKDNFKQMIGMDLDENFRVELSIKLDSVDINMDKAIQNALNSRLEIRNREIELQNAKFRLIETSDQNKFKGNVSVSLGIQGVDKQLANMYDVPTTSPSVSLSFNVPIWDWGAREARIKAARLNVESTEIDLNQESKSINLGIRQTIRNLRNYRNQIEIARKNEKNAQLTYDINLERYNNGDLTGMDLQLYQNQLSQARMDLTTALIDYKMELLNLKMQSLYDFMENEPLLPKDVVNSILE